MRDLNPAVERALEAAGVSPNVSDWLRVLLTDDEGRPAALLARHGLDSTRILGQIPERGPDLDSDALLRLARDHAIRLTADPAFTTDLMLLAVLFHDPMIAESLGVRLGELETLLRSPMVASPTPATPEPARRHS